MEFANISDSGLIRWQYENPQHFDSYWFEKFDGNDLRFWAKRNINLLAITCFGYLVFVWIAPKLMKNRPALKLEKPLAIWNFSLAIFSFFTLYRVAPEVVETIKQPDGWYRSLCVPEAQNYPATFWVFLYAVSKVVELGDTVFLVLRKKPLILLHWFHHFNMLWSTVYMFIEGEPCHRHITIVNSFIHFFMYSYYGFRALNFKVPQKLAMTITLFQTAQFAVGLFLQYLQINVWRASGRYCYRTPTSLWITTFFACAYIYLFGNLFYQSYIAKPKAKKTA